MRTNPCRCLALATALVVISSSTLRAQAPSGTAVAPDTARKDLAVINPFGVVFSFFSGEYEHALSQSASVGFAGTYYAPTDFKYVTGEVKLRYYPSEHAPDGFSVALSAGVTHVSGDLLCFDVCDNSATDRPTAGFELDYNWLLGPSRRFVVGTGIGAKRLFGSKTSGSADGLPTARVVLGVAF
ncbi:MAG TPA: hypothetical protein VN650_16275 [Gemmatimonadaceae bacterium]|nr:hypothetical protein [Gemmatimonadaceae bacterium]